MMIEMTIATIGRLIKNFDMAGYLFSAWAGATGFASGLDGVSCFFSTLPRTVSG